MSNVDLVALFGPEHGMAAATLDAIHVDHATDNRTGVPIYSLYGSTYKPTPEMLDNLDVLVCDIQDIGARFYTYIWSISYILEACGKHNVEVLILDRPNPLGDTVAGSPLDDDLRSFVGRFNIPIRHGMTLGELSTMINQVWNPTPAKLTVITCGGWQRTQLWHETGLEFVTPSPAMPRFSTVLHYTGSCMLEGTMLSEGRGTSLPFEVVGAPYINGDDLAKKLNAKQLSGVRFRPHAFYPTISKFRDKTCYGIQAHITDNQAFDPIRTWLTVIVAIRNQYSDQFEWLRPHQTEYERGAVYHFDRLIGSTQVRQQIDDGNDVDTIMSGWDAYCASFRADRRPYLFAAYD